MVRANSSRFYLILSSNFFLDGLIMKCSLCTQEQLINWHVRLWRQNNSYKVFALLSSILSKHRDRFFERTILSAADRVKCIATSK